MSSSIKEVIKEEIRDFFKLRKVEGFIHIPLLASLCMGIPLLLGLYFNNIKGGLTACLAGLIIVYFPLYASLAERIITLLACSFLFLISYTVGVTFSYNFVISSIAFGLFSMIIHWITLYLKVRPPRSFFFIMICATASCIPFNLKRIPENIGLLAIGSMISCTLALLYSIVVTKEKFVEKKGIIAVTFQRNRYANFLEALIMGFFMFLSLLIGHLLDINNPYWIPVSCAAVMQGATRYHIWKRVFQRITGTFMGLGLCWIILSITKTTLAICLAIIVLQFIIETLVGRNYVVAVIFITPITVLLTEISNPLIKNPDIFISIRFWNILLGSLIGAIGGWIIYHEQIHYNTVRRIRKARVLIKKL